MEQSVDLLDQGGFPASRSPNKGGKASRLDREGKMGQGEVIHRILVGVGIADVAEDYRHR